MGQWSDFPADLVQTIEKLLVLYVDKVRFRSVCVSWNSYLPKMPNHQLTQLPWLLHAATDKNSEASHGLFNPLEKKIYHLGLPEAQGKFFKGSSHGWVATVEDDDINSSAMYLINPLTRARIQLPSRSKFPDVIVYRPDKVGSEYALEPQLEDGLEFDTSARANLTYVHKVVLSSTTPSSEDCVVVAIYGEGGRLAYCKCNDKEWTHLHGQYREGSFADVIFHKGKLHALKNSGHLFVIENIGPNPKVTQIATRPPFPVYTPYLVECSDGGLVMVVRIIDFESKNGHEQVGINNTTDFRVYKLDTSNSSWFVVKNIGDDMLFVGYNLSLSISSHRSPGYKGNCIYFTDNNEIVPEAKGLQGGADMGVFNLEDGSVESLPGYKCDPHVVWPPPVWVTPPSKRYRRF